MKNQVSVLAGAKGIKQAYELVLHAKQADIVCLSWNYEAVIGDFFDRIVAPKLYGQITTREILPDKAENRDEAKTKNASLNQVRFTRMPLTETDFIVTESRVVLISFRPESAKAVVIEETELVRYFTHLFAELWQRAEV
jgi:hypothetical protein